MIDAATQPIDLRPHASLVVAVTGYRDLGIYPAAVKALAATLTRVFADLRDALADAGANAAGVLSPARPMLRTICTGTEGADALAVDAARAAGSTITRVLPFGTEGSNPLPASTHAIGGPTDTWLILPGAPEEGARAYERANEIMLANSDLVVAVWDQKRPGQRGGTGEVVQSAITRGIPVIVVAPALPTPMLLTAPGNGELAWPIASDLPLKPLPDDLRDLVARIVLPPAGEDTRRALLDLINEPAHLRSARFEYQLLLEIFGVAPRKRAAATGEAPPAPLAEPVESLGREMTATLQRIDELAGHYGRLYRSSTTTQILFNIIAAFLSAMALIYLPTLAGATLVVSVAANTLVLFDTKTRAAQRWHERWLDYRVIAERLRCLQFLQPLGLGLSGTEQAASRRHLSWVDWYVRRLQRALAPPDGPITEADLTRLIRQIAEGEVPGQIKYHDGAFRQLGTLDRRLAVAARVSLNAAIVGAVAFMVSAALQGGGEYVAWHSLGWVMIFVLPAAAAAFTAMRAGADLALLAERSAATAAALTELQGVIRATPMTYDRAAVAATRVAGLMGAELSEWRFVFESRRTRTRRANAAAERSPR
ncbi:MAG TPA: hypothetical protein VKX28_15785 [Xanthobacteraceae bacterium]|nr:hypothetical protein [Xanthobacteraceae bacterium]